MFKKNKVKKNKFFILTLFNTLLFFAFFFLLIIPVKAELEINYPEIFRQKLTSETTLPEYIKYIFDFAILISGLILLFILIWSGFIYLTSAGNPVKIKEAKEKISSVFLGIILLFSSYLILTSINPNLSSFKLPLLNEISNKKWNKYISNPLECKPNELSAVAHEIPIGNLVKNLFEQEVEQKQNNKKIKKIKAINLLQATIISFKNFLTKEIKIDSENFNRISDLNKYLKTLSEDCHCAETTAICQKPPNFSYPVGCVGDPCKRVREKINETLDKDNEKWKFLLVYKENFNEIKNAFEDEGRKFRQLIETFENCKKKELLNRREFYDNLVLAEKQKGEIKIIKSHIPAKTDPLTFYCVVGGSIFDYPYIPSEEIPQDEENKEPPSFKETLPPSCPIYIPVGETIIDPATEISYKINRDIEDVIYYIDKMVSGISKMEELISYCNRQHCKVNCSCVPNPCYGCCSLIPCGACVPFCKSRCLQAVGGCFGEPCGEDGRKKIGEVSERIKIYEDKIFSLLDELQGYIQDSKFIINGKVENKVENKENLFSLEIIQENIHTCMTLGPEHPLEKPTGKSFWELVNCELSIGNKGPDGEPIKNCNPQSFYCCSNEPLKEPRFSPSLFSLPSFYNPSYHLKEPYKFSEKGYNNVPYFSQNDPRWKNKYFGCGATLGLNGSAPTSLAMVLNYFGIKTDPIKVVDLILKEDYRDCEKGFKEGFICKVIETLGKGKGIKCEKKNVTEILDGLKNNKIAIIKTRSIPPYPNGGHYVVLTGIKTKWDEDFIYYNDPSYDITLLKKGKKYFEKPSDWLTKKGILEGYLIYNK